LNSGLSVEHQLASLQTGRIDLNVGIHGKQERFFGIAVVDADGPLVCTESEPSLHRIPACDHIGGEHQLVVVDDQRPQRCQTHQLFGQQIPKPAPAIAGQGLIQILASQHHFSFDRERVLKLHGLIGLARPERRLQGTAFDLRAHQRELFKAHLPGLQRDPLQSTAQQFQGGSLQSQVDLVG